MESHKITARFTAINATRIVSPAGDKCQNFEAGETAAVHRDMWSVAIAAGLMPEESLADETVQIQTNAGIVEVPPVPVKKSQEEIVREGCIEACKTLIARGNPNDFTQLGQPRAASVRKLVDFDFTARDVREAFEQAMFEVENDGNNSEEPAESSSSVTE